MYPHKSAAMWVFGVSLALVAPAQAFFLKWGSHSARPESQKSWQSLSPMSPMSPMSYRYQYMYPYDSRKYYQPYQQEVSMQQSAMPIPISVPAGASLTPVSLQHVQLVPCMCPVAPEEAEKLQEQGPGPYVAQTYQTYPTQQIAPENPKPQTNQ